LALLICTGYNEKVSHLITIVIYIYIYIILILKIKLKFEILFENNNGYLMFDNHSYSNTWPCDHAGPRGPRGGSF
jgi:hypothetical protein